MLTSASQSLAHRRAALFALCVAVPGFAAAQVAGSPPVAPPGFEAAFTGALVSTYPDGRIGKIWVSPDGGFVGKGRYGGRNAGSWTISGDRVCMRQSRPIPLPFRYCTALPSDLQHPWSAKAPTGEPVTLRFVPGDRP